MDTVSVIGSDSSLWSAPVCPSVGRSVGRSVIITIKCGKITSMLLSEHLPIIMTDLHCPHRFLDPSASYFRSPSPEPVYSSDGKRMNTREYRKRKELEETRHESIQRMILINPDYKSPPDYK